jgi:cell pole-organizing protein PopZ
MAQDTAEQEPTMEEILASIRRIINDDDEQPAEATEEPVAEAEPEPVVEAEPEVEPVAELEPEPEPEPEPEFEAVEEAAAEEPVVEDEPLELTELVEEDPAEVDLSDDLMIVDADPDQVEPEPVLEAVREPEPEVEEDPLVDAAPATAAAGMFAALSESMRVSSEQGQTLEGIVRELMKPMLKQWLDDNLPAIVEEKVQAEVERIARRNR